MLNDYAGEGGVMIVTGFTDLRRGIDGLAGIIRHQFQIDPFNGALFLFCGRRKDRIRGLYWEGLSADFCYPHILKELLYIQGKS